MNNSQFQSWGFERVVLLKMTEAYHINGTRGVAVEVMVQFAKAAAQVVSAGGNTSLTTNGRLPHLFFGADVCI